MMKVVPIVQDLVEKPLADPSGEVHRQLDALGYEPPQGPVAITAGSRGISHIAAITRAAGDWLRKRGAKPFLVPAMGSHNGGTAEGQRAMIESLGLTESAMGMEIRSSMEVVKMGEVATGSVWMDRHCWDADGVLVINRVKLHTCFSGPVQSGLIKMMVIGMGKVPSATTFHNASPKTRKDVLREMGEVLLASGKIWAGLALLEDGFDQTAEIHAVPPAGLYARETELLRRHRTYFPSLPVEDLRVLVVDEIGKTYSGTGMDTNVIGRRGIHGLDDLVAPRIQVIAALGLSEASQGNALGVGLADFITVRLRNAINEEKTRLNTLTTGDMQRMAIPCTLPDDAAIMQTLGDRYGLQDWLFIPNTLHLGKLFASPDLAEKLASHPRCRIDGPAVEIPFHRGRMRLWSSACTPSPHPGI